MYSNRPPRRATEIGFDGATFGILTSGSTGGFPAWRVEPFASRRHVPGSNRNYLFLMGMGTATITLNAWFDDRAEYAALQARVQTTGRLTLISGMQGQRGDVRHILGITYEDLDATTLTQIADEQFFPDGHVEATVHFERAGAT